MGLTPQQTINGAVSFEDISDKLAALVYLLNSNGLTPEQLESNSVQYQYLGQANLLAAAIYLLNSNESTLTPGALASAAACFQCVPEFLPSALFLANQISDNITPEQLGADTPPFEKITDKWAVIVYLLNTNNLTIQQIQAGTACFQCLSDKDGIFLYLLANYSPSAGFSLGNFPGLLFQFLASPSNVTLGGTGDNGVSTWTSNMGSLPLVLFYNTGIGSPEYSSAAVNGFDALTVSDDLGEMDSPQTPGAFAFNGMTTVMVGQFDGPDTESSNGRFLSFCNQALGEDDYSGPDTWQPAGTLSFQNGGIALRGGGSICDDTADDWTVPCIILSTVDGTTGNVFIYYLPIGGSTPNSVSGTSTPGPLNSDTFSVFANLLQGAVGDGAMCLCAAWNRVLTPTEITKVLNGLSTIFA